MKAKSGGGETMNKNRNVGVRWGDRMVNKVSPSGLSQVGTAVDPKVVTPVVEGRAKGFAPFGNELAKNVGGGGPGTGRTIYKTGSQQMWGSPRQGEMNTAPDVPATRTGGRDILKGYGPDYRK